MTSVTGVLGPLVPEKVVAALVHADARASLGVARPDLEELFVSLTGEGFDVSG